MIDLASLEEAAARSADEVLNVSAAGDDVFVPVEPGGGRHALQRALRSTALMRPVEIALLSPRETDGATHLLVQLARAVGVEPSPVAATVSEEAGLSALRERACDFAQRLATDRLLVLLLPFEWPRPPREGAPIVGASDEGARARIARLQALLRGVADARRQVVVIGRPGAWHPWVRARGVTRVRRALIGPEALRVDEAGDLAQAADEVVSLLRDECLRVSPIEARALVGLAALGVPFEDLAVSGHAREAIFRRFAHMLARQPHLSGDLRCLTLARQPLRRDHLHTVLTSTAAQVPLLHQCALYGEDTARIAGPLRAALFGELHADSALDQACHRTLAGYHRALDGVASPRALEQSVAIDWLEKVHHLANGGLETQSEWRQQELIDRDQYWERARDLSKRARRYDEAAALYRECLERFGRDSYTLHYLGFNLDRAGAPLSEVRAHYHDALAMDVSNPWWNSRWVSFLIGHGTLREAKAAWNTAVNNLDPDGEWLEESPWLALHLHRWVIRRWLALGYVGEARDVLDAIPRRWIDEEAELVDVERLVVDAEESVELGEAVYPPGTPIDDRWVPRLTPEHNGDKSPRKRWWPGRVVSASAEAVVVVQADPESRTAYRTTYRASEWASAAGQPAEQARDYVEIAEYQDASRRIALMPMLRGVSLTREQEDVFARLGWRS